MLLPSLAFARHLLLLWMLCSSAVALPIPVLTTSPLGPDSFADPVQPHNLPDTSHRPASTPRRNPDRPQLQPQSNPPSASSQASFPRLIRRELPVSQLSNPTAAENLIRDTFSEASAKDAASTTIPTQMPAGVSSDRSTEQKLAPTVSQNEKGASSFEKTIKERTTTAATAAKTGAQDNNWLGTGFKRKPVAGAYAAVTASVGGAVAVTYNTISAVQKGNEISKKRKEAQRRCKAQVLEAKLGKRAVSEKTLAFMEDYGKMTAATEALTAGSIALGNAIRGLLRPGKKALHC